MARLQEVSKPTKHELEQEHKVMLTLRAGIVADRDQCEARVSAQRARIAEAQAKIEDFLKRGASAGARLASIDAKIAGIEEEIAEFTRAKKAPKITRRALDELVIAGMGAKDTRLQARAKELWEGMNLKVDHATLWEAFGDLRKLVNKETK